MVLYFHFCLKNKLEYLGVIFSGWLLCICQTPTGIFSDNFSSLYCLVMIVLALPSGLVIGVPNDAVLEEQLSCVVYPLAAFDGCWFGQKEHFLKVL